MDTIQQVNDSVQAIMKDALYSLSEQLGELLVSSGRKLSVAESCTGGWLAKAITDVSGSSAWFDCGIVTYSNEAKVRILGVREDTLKRYGAVSEPTVLEMVSGMQQCFGVQATVAITGIAGPGGGSPEKPVGTVWLGFQISGKPPWTQLLELHGSRAEIRQQAVVKSLQELILGCRQSR